jgi:hypothetical protein
MLQVWLTPNIIFGMCNIWLILRRNVMYLYNKKPRLDQLFHCQSSRYGVIRWIFGTKNKGKLICNIDLMTSYAQTLTVKKLIKMGFFYHKDILHFFFEWSKYITHTKKSYHLISHTSTNECVAASPPSLRKVEPDSTLRDDCTIFDGCKACCTLQFCVQPVLQQNCTV